MTPLPWQDSGSNTGPCSARKHTHTYTHTRGGSVETARPAPVRSDTVFSCCSHLANSTKRTSQRTDTPTGRCHWPARSGERVALLAGPGVTAAGRELEPSSRRGTIKCNKELLMSFDGAHGRVIVSAVRSCREATQSHKNWTRTFENPMQTSSSRTKNTEKGK